MDGILSDDDRAAARELAASFPAWTDEQVAELVRLAAAAPSPHTVDSATQRRAA